MKPSRITEYEGYFDPDETREEEHAVIDPAWEQQQKKTFTAWCNSHLRKVGESITSIEHDFRDGLKLLKLLTALSGETFDIDKGKMRVHKIANVNRALEFIRSKEVKLVSIGAEEIVDGNVKMTLGMIWTIILRFAIQDIMIEDVAAKDGLLLWCQKQTAPYKNVNVKNFSTSFKDGLAFCAIIHRNRPDLLNYHDLKPENAAHNLNLAFDVAEKKLDIPRMLDPEDMIGSVKPDEHSVMAYVSSYYHVFSGASKAILAADRISDLIKANRENSRLIDEYEVTAGKLLDWMDQKMNHFSNRDPLTTIGDAENSQSDCRTYNLEEMPSKLREKSNLELIYNTIQTRLRLSKRPPYVPAVEKQLSTIDDKWNKLDSVFHEYEEWLLLEFHRLSRLELLLRKFKIRCTTHENWTAGKADLLKTTDYLSCNLPELRALMKRHEAFESQLEVNKNRVGRIKDLATEIAELQYHDMDYINNRYNAIEASTEEIDRLSQARGKKLLDISTVLDSIDQLHLEFAKRAAVFFNWAQQAEEELHETLSIRTMVGLESMIATQELFEQSLGDAEEECRVIEQLTQDAERLAKEHGLVNVVTNVYTNIKPGEASEALSVVHKLSKERGALLRSQKEEKAKYDKLREEFAQKASEFDNWMKQHKNNITQSAVEAKGSLEEQAERLKELEGELYKHKHTLDELEQLSQALEKSTDHVHTALSMPLLRIDWEQLFTTLHQTLNLIENQILTRDSRGLSAERMEELRSSFRHFDRNKTGRLEPPEFKACLLSLGHTFGEAKARGSVIGDTEFANVMKVVDPDKKGYVTFDAFLDYMTQESKVDSAEEQIVQSFKHFAGDKGYVTAKDVEQYLPKDDADYCLRFLVKLTGPMGDSGGLDYKKFAHDFHVSPCM